MTNHVVSRAVERYDGMTLDSLASALGVPRVVALATTASTLDDAHVLAERGAPSGTLVLAEEQTAGRGRGGKRWTSPRNHGIWLTLVQRGPRVTALDVVSLRIGLEAARALQPFANGHVAVKWPNDLHVGGRKLAGILVEARWRDANPEWLAVGVGVNIHAPVEERGATGLREGTSRLEVLRQLVPALRVALGRDGVLDAGELAELVRRDAARGRVIREPTPGVVEGISPRGELLVRSPSGELVRHRSGSLVFQEEQ